MIKSYLIIWTKIPSKAHISISWSLSTFVPMGGALSTEVIKEFYRCILYGATSTIVYINCYTIVKSIHYIMDDVVIHFWIHRVAEFQLTTPNDDVTLLAQFTKSRISVWSRRVFLALKKLQLQYKVRLLMLNETSQMKAWIWKYIYWVYPVPNSVLNWFLTRQTNTELEKRNTTRMLNGWWRHPTSRVS